MNRFCLRLAAVVSLDADETTRIRETRLKKKTGARES